MPQAVKVRADIEVGCCAYEGIDAVKNALRAGIACSVEDMPIKINLIAPPLYVVTTTTMDREKGLELLTEALQKIESSIKNSGGIFTIQVAVNHCFRRNLEFELIFVIISAQSCDRFRRSRIGEEIGTIGPRK